MPSTYPYTQPPQPRNWPKIILITLGIIVLALVIIFWVLPFYFNINMGSNNSNPEEQPLSKYDCSKDIYNCGNFTLQSEAQAVYDYCKGQGDGDVHRLDADLNGKACEGLN